MAGVTNLTKLNESLSPSDSSPAMPANAGEGLMSQEASVLGQNVLNNIDYVLLTAGMVTNAINILVFTRPRMRSSSSHYLVAMSAVQLVYITFDVTESVCNMFVENIYASFSILSYLYHVGYVTVCARRTQYIFHCLVSTERLLAVLVPLKAKNYVTATRPAIFIIGSCVFTFIGNIHYIIKYEIIEDSGQNVTTLLRYTDVYLRHWTFFEMLSALSKFIFVYGTLLYLLVTNVLMIVALGRHSAKRRLIDTNVDNETMRRRDKQMTVTILVSTLSFVFFSLPLITQSLVFNIVPDRYGPFSEQAWLFLFMGNLGNTLFNLALSTDFVTYVALSTAYRNTLLGMFRCVLPVALARNLDTTVTDVSLVTKNSTVSCD